VSLRLRNTETLGTKVEIKNMNSLKFIQKAIEFEIERQGLMLDQGQSIIQETRMFDPTTGQTYGMREKETQNDYRYFPEPDLSPLHISEEWLIEIEQNLPPTPRTLFIKFQDQYGLPEYDATVLTETRELAEYFEQACQHTPNYKAAANWIANTIKAQLKEDADIKTFGIQPERLAALIALIDQNQVSNSTASQRLFPLMLQDTGASPLDIAQKHQLIQQSDTDSLQNWIDEVISENPEKVKEYLKGKKGLIGMFMGELMKKSKGQADPKASSSLMAKSLEKSKT
jgi:aspartyl-tRNA(Asn)/glutamyl-tRNA(Gln) amidotransferase subunit B